jgi:hypothetical protein
MHDTPTLGASNTTNDAVLPTTGTDGMARNDPTDPDDQNNNNNSDADVLQGGASWWTDDDSDSMSESLSDE